MLGLGLASGDRVALLLPGSEQYVDVVLALLATPVFPVPLDPRLTDTERGAVLADIDPVLVISDSDGLHTLAAQLGVPPAGGNQRGAARASYDLPLGRPMHVTSGTTGQAKGVFSGALPPRHAGALLAEERDLWGFTSSDVNLVVSPLHHSAPLRFAMGTLLAGGRVVVPGPFDAARLTHAITTERPTTMFCVPTHLDRLFAYWDDAGAPDLSCFRLVAHAGAPCPPRTKDRLIDAFPSGSTWEFYGSTEGQFTACPSAEWHARQGTVGRARPGRTLSVDPDGTIWCAVPEHARFTYWRDPERTAAAWRDTEVGPAFTVGDLGRLDEDDYLYLEGRREDLIISGGVNVYPVEVENALREHPGVADVAVFGVDDDHWGQRVCAAVVPASGALVSTDALTAFAESRLAPAKRPKDYLSVEALPMTATGKVRRLSLPALLLGPAGDHR